MNIERATPEEEKFFTHAALGLLVLTGVILVLAVAFPYITALGFVAEVSLGLTAAATAFWFEIQLEKAVYPFLPAAV